MFYIKGPLQAWYFTEATKAIASIGLVPLKFYSKNLQFPHKVPFTTGEKMPWCPCHFKTKHTGLPLTSQARCSFLERAQRRFLRCKRHIYKVTLKIYLNLSRGTKELASILPLLSIWSSLKFISSLQILTSQRKTVLILKRNMFIL